MANFFEEFRKQKAESQSEQGPGVAESLYQGAKYGLASGILGAGQLLGEKVSGLIGVKDPELSAVTGVKGDFWKPVSDSIDRLMAKQQAQMAPSMKENPISASVGFLAGALPMAAVMGPGGKAASIGQLAARGASAGGVYGAMQYAPSQRDRLGAMVTGAGMGAVGAPLMAGASRAISGAGKGLANIASGRGRRPAVMRDIALDVQGKEGQVLKNLQAGDKYGAPLDIAQASGSRNVASLAKSIPPTKENKRIIEAALGKQEQVGKKVLKEQVGKLAPEGVEGLKAKYKGLYSEVENLPYSKDVNDVLKSSSVYQNQLKKMWASNTIDEKKIQAGTLGEAKALARFMRTKASKSDEVGMLPEMSARLTKALHKNEKLKMADKLFEQEALYKEADQLISSVTNKSLSDISEGSLDAMYRKLFNSDQKINEFIKGIERVGGDGKAARDAIQYLNNIRATPLGNIVGRKTGTGGYQMDDIASNVARKYIFNLQEGRYNKAILSAFLDPNKGGQLSKLLKKGVLKPGEMKQLDSILGQAVSSSMAAEASQVFDVDKNVADLAGLPEAAKANKPYASIPSVPTMDEDINLDFLFDDGMGLPSAEKIIEDDISEVKNVVSEKIQKDARLKESYNKLFPLEQAIESYQSMGVNINTPEFKLAATIPVPDPQDYKNDQSYIKAVTDYYNEFGDVAMGLSSEFAKYVKPKDTYN